MDKTTYHAFLDQWDLVMYGLAGLSLLVSFIVFLAYKIQYATTKGYKEKFDLASSKQIRKYLIVHFAIAAAIFFVCNTASASTVALNIIWFFVRIFISICFGTLYGYVAYLVFSYYYPKKLHN